MKLNPVWSYNLYGRPRDKLFIFIFAGFTTMGVFSTSNWGHHHTCSYWQIYQLIFWKDIFLTISNTIFAYKSFTKRAKSKWIYTVFRRKWKNHLVYYCMQGVTWFLNEKQAFVLCFWGILQMTCMQNKSLTFEVICVIIHFS